MHIKYFGQKIEKDIDFIRPASLTLTSEDLLNLPNIPTDQFSALGDASIDPKQKKLSRKFGGTIRLKKRLSSVPELFIRDFKSKSGEKKKSNTNDYIRHVSNFEALPEDPINEYDKPFLPRPVPSIKLDKNFKSVSSGSVLITTDVYSNQVALPLVATPLHARNTNVQNNQNNINEGIAKTSSDFLLDEILTYYQKDYDMKPSNLQEEIDNVLVALDNKNASIKKPLNNLANPKIVSPEYDSMSLTSLPTLERYETGDTGPKLDTLMSSPEYTGNSGSDAWSSSGAEFSDADSITASINHIPVEPKRSRTLDPCRVHKTVITAQLFQWHDDLDYDDSREILENTALKNVSVQSNIDQFDNSLKILQNKINNIEIASTRSYSGTSSIYTAL
ncbi:hypothetical protein TPHA_0G00760 [Tetrapisispora phaffii CBS 4417]|uniref:Uncharacterized protein n=1 Tax=Tetrapisispora phaffii (strain ATCC 24235 / CBS 4417 / NBRC 1672 / NRRL Y-8282 / UCD 70-5) TaxID=1071381 RepID=G8BVI4_TETPH|nr:hypothetical protein TPHA_0G00760 [Tetrapisispora phaffii CBS 4417]CCE63912.1 hypothetical protein TPHA_0G00760 [Tetrapisispora phaffii CBS 4417]